MWGTWEDLLGEGISADPVFVLCLMHMLLCVLKGRHWAGLLLYLFSSISENRICCVLLSCSGPDVFMPGMVASDSDLGHMSQQLLSLWPSTMGCLQLFTSSCLVLQLISCRKSTFWLFALAQEFFFSYFRCWENGSAWARFLHASLPSATGRQDVLWPYCCWGMQGYVGHFVLSWCRHTVAFQWQLLTFPAETSMATVVHKVQGCSDPLCRTCFVLSKLYWI